MDGMAYTTIVSSDIVWPSGLAIDYQTLTLFWSDASLDRLESSDYNGWNRTILIERRFIFYPFGLAYHNGSLYWGDWVVGFVYRLTVIDPGDHGYVRAVLGNEPTGIKVVSETNQPLGILATSMQKHGKHTNPKLVQKMGQSLPLLDIFLGI